MPMRRKASSPRRHRAVQIVVTPASGTGQAVSTARQLRKALRSRGYKTDIRTFADFASLVRWAETHRSTFSHLICVGGDSTLGAAAAAAVRLSVPLLPVPSGFGNVFTRVFGHPEHVAGIVKLLEEGEVRRIDVGVDQEGIVLCHRSYGFLADIEEAFEKERAKPMSQFLRYLAYCRCAARSLLTVPLPSIRVEIDGKAVAEDAVLVTVANVETYRGFLSLTPAATPLDGLFDVFIVPRMTKPRLLAVLVRLMLRMHGRWDAVRLFRGKRLTVAVEGRLPEELEVLRRALPVVVPEGSVEDLAQRQADAVVPVENGGDRAG